MRFKAQAQRREHLVEAGEKAACPGPETGSQRLCLRLRSWFVRRNPHGSAYSGQSPSMNTRYHKVLVWSATAARSFICLLVCIHCVVHFLLTTRTCLHCNYIQLHGSHRHLHRIFIRLGWQAMATAILGLNQRWCRSSPPFSCPSMLSACS